MRKKNSLWFFALTLLLLIGAVTPLSGAASGSGASAENAVAKVKNDIVMRTGSAKAMFKGKLTYIDGMNLNVIPFTKSGETYVPLRFIVESLGGKVAANSNTSYTVTVSNKKVTITVNSRVLDFDGLKSNMNQAALIENDRLYVPLSAVTSITGKNVFNENGLIIISDNKAPLTLPGDAAALDKLKAELSVISSFGSYDELKDYLAKQEEELAKTRNQYYLTDDMVTADAAMPMPAEQAESSAAEVAGAPESSPSANATDSNERDGDYSEVNVQVKGVDEADIIRTDGTYIYALSLNQLVIVKAYPSSEMKVLSRYNFSAKNGGTQPIEMYADKDKLTVITNDYSGMTNILVFDITDKENPKIIKETGIKGYYLSSRKIGNDVYVTAVSYMYAYTNNGQTPEYYNSGKAVPIPAPDICVFPGPVYNMQTLTIAGISLNDIDREPDISQYMGAGENIYVSGKYMYIAQTSYNYGYDDISDEMPWLADAMPQGGWGQSTIIHKFALYDGHVSFIGSGAVPGYILNQFSMDEYASYFRIATSTNNANNVYILDSQLKIKSKIEDIAPGEHIYSTRFMGNKGYMVTFKTVDPLFVIDLNPDDPKILGALKIPGYSDYLHPYDENTLIGFGKDTVEHKGTALYQGMKIAIFDVTDVSNPKERFVEVIGGRGTDSPLLYDHKALLFDKNKNLLAFPVTVYEGGDGLTSYGTFTFQGAYVYDISLEKGFVKRGEITHLTADEYKKAGNYYYDTSSEIRRLLYIGDSLYAFSDRQLSAHNIANVKYINSVKMSE